MSLKVEIKEVLAISDQCKKNAPKIEAAFSDSVLRTLKESADATGMTYMDQIVERSEKMIKNSAIPVQEAIAGIADALQTILEVQSRATGNKYE